MSVHQRSELDHPGGTKDCDRAASLVVNVAIVEGALGYERLRQVLQGYTVVEQAIDKSAVC